MQAAETQNTTSAAIVRWYESRPQEHRPHLGASIIGHPCDRHIWMTWRWALKPSFPGRVLRLFSTGQREESRLVEELRGIGATVWETDPATGAQWRVSAHGGHFGGSLDGIAKGVPEDPKTPCVLEFKTAAAKSWKDTEKKGVKESKPQHWAQMQCYMGLMELERALYLIVNKDTDEVFSEWVEFDNEAFQSLMSRAQRLIEATQPPVRFSDDADNFQCKWCSFHSHCHGGQAAEPNCRTCVHSTPLQQNGEWRCEKNADLLLTTEQQRDGCSEHLLIPSLIPYAEPVDGGEGYVAYRHLESGLMFANGPEDCSDIGATFSSSELHRTVGSLLPDVIELKNQFAGARVANGGPTKKPGLIDMESDDLDALPTKVEHPKQKATRARIKKSVEQLHQLAGVNDA